MLTVACVWVGNKYSVEYVERLRDGVARYMRVPYRFACYTDRYESLRGVEMVHIAEASAWPGWWSKMNLFRYAWPRVGWTLYLDLDTVIVGDLSPLADWPGDFGICQNFTKLAGLNTPCNYGSCVMSLAPGFGDEIFNAFAADAPALMAAHPCGDQHVIEKLAPNAAYLQDYMPPGFFLHYKKLTDRKPDGCSVVIFAGAHKPDNCAEQWIKDAWK